MAGALVGGAFLSGFINVVFDRLLSPEAANLVIGKKLDSELVERLKTALCAAEALLVDAEHKQFDNPLVKNWLDSLKDAVYEADDLLDLVFTKAATQKEVSTFWSRFLNFQDREMVNKMEGVVKKIEEIVKRKYVLGLKEIPSDNNSSWRTSTSLEVEGNIYGRENDQEAIVNIISIDSSEQQLAVIPIVGMGGVGKTTLAQWVYSDQELMKRFDFKAWVCVSEEFNIFEVTKTIIGGVTSSTCNLKDLNLLQLDLKEKLLKKKFFIVLDDVWSDDIHKWNNFKTPFRFGAKGSTILVTTRSKDVASVVQTSAPYFLNELSDYHCWLVFANNACFSESNGSSTLEEIGRKIAKKCKGLPLAAEALGRLLRTKHDVKEWINVLDSDIWEFSVKNSKIIPALLIIYYHLPAHLKRCFIYCSLFPKDHKFIKDELVLLWMAEDFLRPPKRGETLEEVGCECFDDLASKLFFKQLRNDAHYVMHDLLHDLAIFLAGDFYFGLEELGNAEELCSQTRHLSYGRMSHPISNNFCSIDQVESLRTFLPINFSHPSFNTESLQCVILSNLKHLRVLSFHSFGELNALPDSIGELIHLRYLDLSRTWIKMLPESLCDLYNLQTLKLYGCSYLATLPSGMHNLVNLRHLDITDTNLKEMPREMSKLKQLNFLSYFIVGKQEDNGIKELGGLSKLHGKLQIRNMENVFYSSEAMGARLMDKANTGNLSLHWSSDGDIVSDTQRERDIFDKLQPHDGLKSLSVQGYRGTRFSDWVGCSSYHNMTRVSFSVCRSCCMLPSLGQLPSLKSLFIEYFDGLKIISAEFYKDEDDYSSVASPFPSLVYLRFHHMPYWEVWNSFDSNAFPQLKMLEILDCPRLKGDLPNHLPALETLEIRQCQQLEALPNHLPALETLEIHHCQQLGALPNHLPALETLYIYGCQQLGALPNHLPALEKVQIHQCQQLVSSLPRAPTIRKLWISESDKIGLHEIPLSMQSLSLVRCQLLVESMFQAMTIARPTCLEELEISYFPTGTSLPWDCLPGCLKSLGILDCRKLEFPHPQQRKHGLLTIQLRKSCDSLTTFPLEAFPNLEHLSIEGCRNLDSLSLSQSQHTALHDLTIHDCPNFVLFPKEGLAAPNMATFMVINCGKLKSLPCHMNTLLPNLETLEIDGCPEIDSFPEGGLPSNLKSLEVRKCEKLLSNLSSMGMHEALTYLTLIDGSGCESSVKSFPKERLLPPLPSLTTLHLNRFSNMETLECKELLRLTSLQQLVIQKCSKLENIAGERLPGSLWELEIRRCPLLAEGCKNKHPQIWPKISHIHGIRVDGRWVS